MPPVVVYDANVLYPAPLRDLRVRLALGGVVRAHWTDDIHDEWTRSVLRQRPGLSAVHLARTRRLMDTAVRGALVSGHGKWVPRLTLPDPDDRHVLAAAIHAGARYIVTFNVKDFPDVALARWGVEAREPNRFLIERIEERPEDVCEAVRRQRASLRNPPVERRAFVDMLRHIGLGRAVDVLEAACPDI